jgi:hypothetical protein
MADKSTVVKTFKMVVKKKYMLQQDSTADAKGAGRVVCLGGIKRSSAHRMGWVHLLGTV